MELGGVSRDFSILSSERSSKKSDTSLCHWLLPCLGYFHCRQAASYFLQADSPKQTRIDPESRSQPGPRSIPVQSQVNRLKTKANPRTPKFLILLEKRLTSQVIERVGEIRVSKDLGFPGLMGLLLGRDYSSGSFPFSCSVAMAISPIIV